MPQMSPIWWTFIMMITTYMLVVMMSINYFNTTNKIINKKLKNTNFKIVWKW